jgi:hypothetical protein
LLNAISYSGSLGLARRTGEEHERKKERKERKKKRDNESELHSCVRVDPLGGAMCVLIRIEI